MAYNHLEEIPQPLTTLQMHGNHFLPAFWLLPFLLSANISVKALPQAQSDFNIIVPLNNHDGRPTGTLGQGGGDSDFIIPNEGPTYPILLNEQLLRPEPPLRGDVAVVDVVVANNNDQNCRSSSSSSSDNNNNNYSQSSLFRKREVLACPPPRPDSSPDLTPEPTPKSTPKSTPDSTPELIAPHITFQESDDDKCPPNLMGMSRIPVCDSGRPGEDSMRLAGFDYYTLFKITPGMYLYIFILFYRLFLFVFGLDFRGL